MKIITINSFLYFKIKTKNFLDINYLILKLIMISSKNIKFLNLTNNYLFLYNIL
jgi:hypothetical protein